MIALVKYEAARAALQAAHDVDEVKDIRDKAQAMALYAKQANDTALVEWATEIKVRAERRAGGMLAEAKANGSRADSLDNLKTGSQTSPKSHDATSGDTLENIGISKTQSSRWQKLAAIPEEQFERAVAEAKGTDGEVTTAALLRTTKSKPGKTPAKPRPPVGDTVKLQAKVEELTARCEQQQEALDALVDTDKTLEAFKDNEQVKEMQILRLELKSCKRRRDELMAENASLKKQVAYLQKKLDKK